MEGRRAQPGLSAWDGAAPGLLPVPKQWEQSQTSPTPIWKPRVVFKNYLAGIKLENCQI